jgi:hypothetical protein
VAVGIPGYVVPTDQTASLFLKSPAKVASTSSLQVSSATPEKAGNGWARYQVKASGWGEARLTVTYADGQKQTISYYITKPLETVMADIGHFTTTRQWFEGKGDPFHRSPAILLRPRGKPYPHPGRVSFGDERRGRRRIVGGCRDQAARQSRSGRSGQARTLVDETVLGTCRFRSTRPQAGAVKKSIFYYDPKAFPNYYDRSTGRRGPRGRRRTPMIWAGPTTIPMSPSATGALASRATPGAGQAARLEVLPTGPSGRAWR